MCVCISILQDALCGSFSNMQFCFHFFWCRRQHRYTCLLGANFFSVVLFILNKFLFLSISLFLACFLASSHSCSLIHFPTSVLFADLFNFFSRFLLFLLRCSLLLLWIFLPLVLLGHDEFYCITMHTANPF